MRISRSPVTSCTDLWNRCALRKERASTICRRSSRGRNDRNCLRTSAVYAELPHKFEAGTVNAAGAAGFGAAIKYVESVGFDAIHKLELEASSYAFERMQKMPHIHIIGSDKAEEHNGIITFTIDDVHPHDVSEIFASDNIA
ncbi:MAG: aminotransferase class V-fold PLP-dependent enzyme, partial [Clostridia bacterium]